MSLKARCGSASKRPTLEAVRNTGPEGRAVVSVGHGKLALRLLRPRSGPVEIEKRCHALLGEVVHKLLDGFLVRRSLRSAAVDAQP